MDIRVTDHAEHPHVTYERWGCFDENGICLSAAGVSTAYSRLGKDYVCTNLIGGVGTPPQYRRKGCVRATLNAVFDKAQEYGWCVSMLHPFSFGYYRMFGYERVADHRILTFPMKAIDFLPRYADLVPLREGGIDRTPDALALFDRWSAGRNCTLRRVAKLDAHDCFANDRRATFLYCEDGAARGYITLEVQNHLVVNHMEGDFLHVYELVYDAPEVLEKLLGFVRIFDGQCDAVKLHNIAMQPEVELFLRHYTHTHIQVLPDLMAKLLDLPAVLNGLAWPDAPGHFTMQVQDALPLVGGCWEVEYANGSHSLKKLADGTACDLTLTGTALTPILYGYEQYTPQLLQFAHEVEVSGDVTDFLRAFPKQNCGLYEHF